MNRRRARARYLATLTICLLVLCSAPPVHADVPLAARLLSISYNDTTSGGLRVTVTGPSLSIRGITNDGTTIYLLNDNGNIVTMPMSSLVGSPGGTVSIAGTLHSVGWGAGGAPSFGVPDGRSLAYSHGCLFINDDASGSTPSPIHLYCIDISDWSVTQIAVPSDEPLPAGHDWGRGAMIDFSDSRIGKVSAYAATTTPTSGYASYLRMYTVSGTGKSATIAWSHDYFTHDTENWNTDEHGIATDGTYLYRIEFIGGHLASGDFKSWPLDPDSSPDPVYAGLYTVPNDGGDYNVTFLSHDHTGNRYMVGGYGTNHFYITSAADPGPGPGNPLTPAFGTLSYTAHGFTTQVTNYDAAFTWDVSATAGSASIDGSGLITVTGLSGEGASATVTASTTRSGFPDGSASVSGTIPDVTPPVISDVATAHGTATSTDITWSTDEAASTKVVYSADTLYASSTSETDTSSRVTSHTASIADLLACAQYNYEVVSADAAGNYATSTGDTFTTTGCSGGATPSSATSTSVTVSAAATSTVSDSGRTLTVATPANFTATSTSIVIQIKGLPSTTVLDSIGKPSSNLSSAASIVFDVTALIDNTTVLDSFDVPVRITYTYTDADVSSLDESSLAMYHYHDGVWLRLDNCSVNTSANTITCDAPSFSTFAIFGSPPASASGNSSSGGGLRWCSGPSAPGWNASLPDGGCRVAVAPTIVSGRTNSAPRCPDYTFARTLRFGMIGEDVRNLQKLMNCLGYKLSDTGPGSPGKETRLFVDRTYAAVIKFQETYSSDILTPVGATKGTGIFAGYSRKKAQVLTGIQ